MIRLSALLFLAFLLPQDDAQIKEWIRQLDDSELSVRDDALQALIKAGDKALPLLKEALSTDNAEVKLRVQTAVKGIETARKTRDVYRDTKPVTIKLENKPVGEILDALSKETGIRIDRPAEMVGTGTVSLTAGTLMQALDQLCAAQEKLAYDWDDAGFVKIRTDKYTPYPASYWNGFKIQIVSVEVTRTTNFKDSSITMNFGIGSAWETHLKPMRQIKYEFTKATDDSGAEIAVVGFGSDVAGVAGLPAGMLLRIMGAGVGDPTIQQWSIKGLAGKSKAIKTLVGTATYSFPLDYTPVAFENAQSGDSQEVGDFKISVDSFKKKNSVDFTVTKMRGDMQMNDEEIDRRLEKATVIVIDENNKEHKADSVGPPNSGMGGMMAIGRAGNKSVKLRAVFPTLEGAGVKTFKLRFIDSTFEKSVPFEIRDIQLP